jgi:hypothetical protein
VNHALLPRTANANLPATYEAAKLALSECNRIDECKDWSDKAQALASYARQADDHEMEKTAMRIRARAVRRCGELLKEIDKAQGGDRKSDNIKNAPAVTFDSPRQHAAKEAGLSKKQAVTAIRVANVPNEIFVEQVDSAEPPTITKLAEQGTKPAASPPMATYEKLGMTKQAFQAGMYFRGDLEDFVKAIKKHSPQDIVDGSNEKEKARIREAISIIDKFNDQLIAKL